MSPIITVLVGLIGVLLGVLLASLLQRRNWQLQEATKAYAALFDHGNRELEICETLQYAGLVGNDALAKKAYGMLEGQVDSRFLRTLSRCWLLEKDPGIRAEIERIQEKYKSCRLKCRYYAERPMRGQGGPKSPQEEKLAQAAEEKEERRPGPEDVKENLGRLLHKVAGRYFHGNAQAPSGPRQDQ